MGLLRFRVLGRGRAEAGLLKKSGYFDDAFTPVERSNNRWQQFGEPLHQGRAAGISDEAFR